MLFFAKMMRHWVFVVDFEINSIKTYPKEHGCFMLPNPLKNSSSDGADIQFNNLRNFQTRLILFKSVSLNKF